MKSSKLPLYIFVILLSLVLTYACYTMIAKRKPDMATKGDIRVVYNHSKEEDAGFPYRFYITASVTAKREHGQPPAADAVTIPKDGVKVYWLKDDDFKAKYPNIQKSDFQSDTMATTERGGIYAYAFQPLERTKKYRFFMEVTDSQGNSLTLPEDALGAKHFFHVTYKQDPNKWGLMVHILLMIVALFMLLHGFYYAFNYVWNKQDWSATKALSSILWGWICYGISGFPLGIWIEYEKYGTYWTGFPLGWDMTDSKTLFNFVYWMIILILMKGSIFHKDPTRNAVSYKTFAWLTILGGILTMLVRFGIGHGDI